MEIKPNKQQRNNKNFPKVKVAARISHLQKKKKKSQVYISTTFSSSLGIKLNIDKYCEIKLICRDYLCGWYQEAISSGCYEKL